MAYAGRLQQAAQHALSRQEVVSILDDMFPPTNSAAKSRLLREAFAAACPAQPYKVCSSTCWVVGSAGVSKGSRGGVLRCNCQTGCLR